MPRFAGACPSMPACAVAISGCRRFTASEPVVVRAGLGKVHREVQSRTVGDKARRTTQINAGIRQGLHITGTRKAVSIRLDDPRMAVGCPSRSGEMLRFDHQKAVAVLLKGSRWRWRRWGIDQYIC